MALAIAESGCGYLARNAVQLLRHSRACTAAVASTRIVAARNTAITRPSPSLLSTRSHHSGMSSSQLDQAVTERYRSLDQRGHVLATYIWIDGTGQGLRTKTRTLTSLPSSPSQLPIWNFDGSSTGQASGHDSDVYLKPVAIFKDPFIVSGGENILVMCETLGKDGEAHPTNRRHSCSVAMEAARDHDLWFGIEQEFTLLDVDMYPLGWPKQGFPGPQGPYYCGVGATKVFGRQLMDAHHKACLYAGVNLTGTNVEVMPGQFEYQMGISNDSHVVIYDNNANIGMFSAPRVWWMFKAFGHKDVSILNGGLPAWIAGGFPTISGPPDTPTPVSYTAHFNSTLVRSLKDVGEALAQGEGGGTQVVDARSKGRFVGKDPEPCPTIPSGHMIGAISLFFRNLIDQNSKLFKSKEEIMEEFSKAGVEMGSPMVATCGSGVSACFIPLAMAVSGNEIPPVYDGSWFEWVQKAPEETMVKGVRGVDLK